MSEDIFHNDDWEKLLREKADNFSMQPEDEVWERINDELHPRRKRRVVYWLAALLLLAIGAGGYFILFTPGQLSLNKSIAVQTIKNDRAALDKNKNENNADEINHSKNIASQNNKTDHPAVQNKNNNGQKNKLTLTNNQSAHASQLPANKKLIAKKKEKEIVAENNNGQQENNSQTKNDVLRANNDNNNLAKKMEDTTSSTITASSVNDNQSPVDSIHNLSVVAAVSGSAKKVNPASNLPAEKKDTALLPGQFKDVIKTKKLHWEIFITPAISYRNFYQQNKNASSSFNSSGPQEQIPSSELGHSAAAAFTAGVHISFRLHHHVQFTTGLELSKYRYNIKAAKITNGFVGSPNQNYYIQQSASLGAFTANSNSSFGVAPGNLAGTHTSELHNIYTMIELPALIDWEIPLHHQLTVHLATGAGFNYLIHKQANIYAATYKRYFTDNSLVRNWNLNYQFTTYLSIPMHKTVLHIGPDFRYLLFSSYKNYPVKEHPFSAGLHVGLSW